jgi:hypothetical protein
MEILSGIFIHLSPKVVYFFQLLLVRANKCIKFTHETHRQNPSTISSIGLKKE